MLSLFAMVAMPPAGERGQTDGKRMSISQGQDSVLFIAIDQGHVEWVLNRFSLHGTPG